ncbi:MAG: transcription termination/antitermination protein NusG [Oscillospiraceae bacterium]|nr:transcription termination/antitermination protein NusG [Oscillospiraceae bacterium]
MQDKAKWYVIHTYSGYEKKVASNIEKTVINRRLQDFIHEIRVPTETVVEIKDNKKREVERKIFPGYVLVKMIMNDESWHGVRNVRGCTGFIGESTKPVPLTDDEVKKLGVEIKKTEVSYSVGDTVRILDGPLGNRTGVVDSIDIEKNCVTLIVSMFGRETPVELELIQVKRENYS